VNLAGFRICLAKDTVHILSSCYGLLTALVLLNSSAIWCNAVVPKLWYAKAFKVVRETLRFFYT